MKRRVLVVVALWVVACASSAVEPQAPEPTPASAAATPAPTPVPSAPPSSASAAEVTPPAASTAAPADTAPPPLRGGHATPPFARASEDAGAEGPCTPETLRARLSGIVGKCRPKAKSLCGSVAVRASGDASAVRVSVDLGTTTGATDFVRCVTDQVNAVRWECAEPGKDIQVDLGCKL